MRWFLLLIALSLLQGQALFRAQNIVGTAPFLTGFTTGTLRSNWNDYIGMKFTVGASPLTVTSLGRVCVAGNSGTHTIKLVLASDGTDVAGGSLSLDMTSCTAGQFKYAALASPVVLSPSTAYYLASLETNLGDQWYDSDAVTSAAVGTVNSSVYFDGAWNLFGTSNTSYVPANFLYQP